MFGNIEYINRQYLKKEHKLKSFEDPYRILSVINDEYWKDWKRKLEYSKESYVYLDNIGSFSVSLVELKKYIWNLVKKLREKRKTLKAYQDRFENFDTNTSAVYSEIKNLELKISVSWSQLEEQRIMMIMRYIRWTEKKRRKDPDFMPTKDYTWFPYSFKENLLNNSKNYYK